LSLTYPEWGRLAFLERRDGEAAALAFARQTYAIYRQTLRHGFRMPGRPSDPNNRRGGRGLMMRRELVESCIVFRWYIRGHAPKDPVSPRIIHP
jgi:hypothetical protein